MLSLDSMSTDRQHKPRAAAFVGTVKGPATYSNGDGLNLRNEREVFDQ